MKKVAIFGASGFVGTALQSHLKAKNYEIVAFSRNGSTRWHPELLDGWESELEGCQVVVNLAGENIGAGRWTKTRKKRLISSRIDGANTIFKALAKLKIKPELYIQISGIGFYGNRNDEILNESASKGQGFIADLSDKIEKNVFENREIDFRTAVLRFGIVLGKAGGALPKLLLPFKLLIGGPLGNGKQYVSWVHIDDICRMIEYVISNESLSGPINCVAPNPITNKQLSKITGKVLRRPAFMPAPAFMLKLILGQLGTELLLFGQRTTPEKLLNAGFNFNFSEYEPALREILSVPKDKE